ncbi:MAG: 1-acyl-sn-glycerol-3-phosphate acyltransferase [Bifidobacteriaceae bacterium]|jgi:1-acyl-sn-glycerol-3-phosphate acyltransferase|nr:1-acyl-sn-glycerol-3-phosphate acyltransferase [Bifidobacteriaceae bacterium]MCI1979022.1 1-acyl-sn-glycerol-3-phosphate acyltransferase [Bifidobacteriaceae bacterium]
MIIGGSKRQVVRNIEKAVEEGKLNVKVEVGDPHLNKAGKITYVRHHLDSMHTFRYRFNNWVARHAVYVFARCMNTSTTYIGLEKLKGIRTGAIVTSNHFNPIEVLTVLTTMRKAGKRRTFAVSQDTNLAMKGFIGYFMRYFDTIPITKDRAYLSGRFLQIIDSTLRQGHFILIYPEEEMWFNYRRPRPGKHGAYDFAAQAGVPVISCFTEIIDTGIPERNNDEFNHTRYVVHVLDPIFPDPHKSVAENSRNMLKADNAQRRAMYEKIYRKSVEAPFDVSDIAGWRLGL